MVDGELYRRVKTGVLYWDADAGFHVWEWHILPNYGDC